MRTPFPVGYSARTTSTGDLSGEQQFFCPVRGFHHRLDEGDAQLALFQFENPVNGAAGGRGHRVLQQGRMVAGLQHNAGSA